MPETRFGVPGGFDIGWSGIDSTTPDGFFAIIGTDALGNRTDLLMRGGDPSLPETAVLAGRVVWSERPGSYGNTVYAGWNSYMASDLDPSEAFARIAARALRVPEEG